MGLRASDSAIPPPTPSLRKDFGQSLPLYEPQITAQVGCHVASADAAAGPLRGYGEGQPRVCWGTGQVWGGNAPGLREHATGSGCLLMPQERQGAINHQSSQGTGVPPRPSQSRPPGFSDNHTLTLSWPSVLPRRDWPTPSALLGIVPRDQHRRREGAIVLQLQTVCVTRPPAGQRAQGRDALAGPTGWGAGPAGGRGVSGETGSARVSPDSAGSEGRGGPSRAVRPGTDTHLSPESWPPVTFVPKCHPPPHNRGQFPWGIPAGPPESKPRFPGWELPAGTAPWSLGRRQVPGGGGGHEEPLLATKYTNPVT